MICHGDQENLLRLVFHVTVESVRIVSRHVVFSLLVLCDYSYKYNTSHSVFVYKKTHICLYNKRMSKSKTKCEYCLLLSHNKCYHCYKDLCYKCSYSISEELCTAQQYSIFFRCTKCEDLKKVSNSLEPEEMELIMKGISELISFKTYVIEEALYCIPPDLSHIISEYAIEENSIEFR
jgi:hypothetical protein